MKKVYLLTTDHLEEGLWFREKEDFIVAMNFVGIQAADFKQVFVLAFILMSNHVHFVLKGRREDVLAFVNQFKHRYSIYYRNKYGVKEFLRRNRVDVKEIPYDDDAVEKAIAYVLMNCVAANICSHPSQYPWGTGSVYFNSAEGSGRSIGPMSGRECKRLFHSHFNQLPKEWMVSEDGYILPQNYVDVKAVEALFRSPKRMNYFLVNSSKAKRRLELADANLPAFRDQTILFSLPDLCRSLFNKNSFCELQEGEQCELVRQIRFRFSADANQIGRVCGITYADAARLLDHC